MENKNLLDSFNGVAQWLQEAGDRLDSYELVHVLTRFGGGLAAIESTVSLQPALHMTDTISVHPALGGFVAVLSCLGHVIFDKESYGGRRTLATALIMACAFGPAVYGAHDANPNAVQENPQKSVYQAPQAAKSHAVTLLATGGSFAQKVKENRMGHTR